MNQEQAKAWLPLIQAVAEGKTLQRKIFNDVGIHVGEWVDCTRHLFAVIQAGVSVNDVRIKPEPKKQSYRVALLKDDGGYWAKSINHESYDFSDDKDVTFVDWLTDWIEYELPEGEA